MQQSEKNPTKMNNGKAPAVRSKGKQGYSRVKSDIDKRRQVTRTPDMSHPNARNVSPSVSIGNLPKAEKKKNAPLAGLYVEPQVHTVIDTRKRTFPVSTILLAVICTVLMLFVVISYVNINEVTVTVSKLKTEVAALGEEYKTKSAALEKRDDLELIEKRAKDLGMVKIDEVDKQYIEIDIDDSVEVVEPEENKSKGIISNIMSAIGSLFR